MNFSGYAVESWIGFILWPLFLFIILKSSEAVGAVASLSMILTLVVFYFVGRKTDGSDKEKMLKVSSVFYSVGWISRLFAYNFTSVFLVDTYIV